MKDKKQYLEGLNSLRFFAALLVLLGHGRQNLVQYDIMWFNTSPVFYKGDLAVDFFFVLSGFLLTFLAIKEYKTYHRIDIKQFYLRRIFRVLPLYYLAVFLAYLLLGVVYPAIKGQTYLAFSIGEGLPYHLLLLPNYVIARWDDDIGSLYSLWSIGVEEQYYLFFPLLMGFVLRNNNALAKMVGVTTVVFVLYWLVSKDIILINNETGKKFLLTMRFHMMLIGGVSATLFACCYEKIARFIENKPFQLLVWLIILAVIFYPDADARLELLHGLTFGCLLLIVVNKKHRLINLEVKPFIYLGSISYGIYIFHPFVSYFLRFLLENAAFTRRAVTSFPILYYLLEVLLSIAVAHLSYQYYEKYFLRLKSRYSRSSRMEQAEMMKQ